MQLETDYSILSRPHPWDDDNWKHYLRVRRQEDSRQRYCDELAADLKRADGELALLAAERERFPDLCRELVGKSSYAGVAVEIEEEIAALRARIRHLLSELDRVQPNWRTWLKPDDPRYDPVGRPHAHIGEASLGWKRGGFPPPWWDG
jgi:hypothetical protein